MFILFFVLLLLCGCTAIMEQQEPELCNDGSVVELLFDVEGKVEMRSCISPDEYGWEDINVVAYSGGRLSGYAYGRRGERLSLHLDRRKVYDIYAVAGVGEMVPELTKEDFMDNAVRISSINELEYGFPLVWKSEDFSLVGEQPRVKIALERLVSRIELSVDKSALEGLEVTSVRLCQSPLVVYPFLQGGSRARESVDVSDGDYATDSFFQSF